MTPLRDAVHLLGHQVVVTLEHAQNEREAVVARGRLLSFADSGEVTVEDEMGFVHYCWPMLDVRAAVGLTGEATT